VRAGPLHRIAGATALALLLSPLCVAGGPLATGTTAAITALPPAELEASLRALALDGAGCAPATLAGTAARARLDNDTTETMTVATQQTLPPTMRHASSNFTAATVSAHLLDGCRLLAVPIGAGASLASLAGRLAPADGGPVEYAPRGTADRGPTRIDPTLAIAADASGPVRITGDIRLVLWTADVTVQDNRSSVTVRAGVHGDPVAGPVPPEAVSLHGRQTEAYLDLYGADLTLGAAGAPLLLNAATLAASQGSLRLDEAALAVAGRPVSGGQVHAQAPATLDATRSGPGLDVQVRDAGGLDVDGQAVRVGGGALRGTLAWWLLAGVAVAVATAVALAKGAARRLAATERYGRTASVAATVAWLPLLGRHERVIQVVALLKLGRFADAERALAHPVRWRALRPTWEFLMAHLRAQAGRRAEAVGHLAACLVANSSFGADARADPVLRPLVDEARERAKAGAGRPEGYA
jgi:hypothetical protein